MILGLKPHLYILLRYICTPSLHRCLIRFFIYNKVFSGAISRGNSLVLAARTTQRPSSHEPDRKKHK